MSLPQEDTPPILATGVTGRIRYYNQDKRFGFAVRDDDQEEVFFHRRDLKHAKGVTLYIGDIIKFDVTHGTRTPRAVNVVLVSDQINRPASSVLPASPNSDTCPTIASTPPQVETKAPNTSPIVASHSGVQPAVVPKPEVAVTPTTTKVASIPHANPPNTGSKSKNPSHTRAKPCSGKPKNNRPHPNQGHSPQPLTTPSSTSVEPPKSTCPSGSPEKHSESKITLPSQPTNLN